MDFLASFSPDTVLMLSGWTLYVVVFFLPFIQEDAAVIGAATASIVGAGSSSLLFAAILLGLTASDVWKYWIGWAARRYEWAHKFSKKPGVAVAGTLVRKELFQTLLAARFVPGTRIPTYLACGFFQTPYVRFVIMVAGTALLYVVIMFSVFHLVGEVAGEQAKFWLPVIALTLIGSYILFRYYRHRNNRRGPMTPLSNASDKPIDDQPSNDHAIKD